MSNQLSKEDLYNSVKTLIENEKPHKILNQHKLYTLFSIAFQYMLYSSTKDSGAYIIRFDTPQLAEKILRKSKDTSTRKFLQSLMLPRRFKYGKSVFYLDFFNIGSWNMTNEIPVEKIRGAIIVKNTSSQAMENAFKETEEDIEVNPIEEEMGEHYYLKSLLSIADKTITIAYDEDLSNLDELEVVTFPFIVREKESSLGGVTISENINID